MPDPTLAGTPLNRYFHVCAFFNSRDEEYSVLGPFYKEGIEWREKTLHIVDPAFVDGHKDRLRAIGIDVAGCEECGQLQVLPSHHVYLRDGAFDQDQMLKTVDAVVAAAFSEGYPRTRIMGNMMWAFEGHPGSENLIEYEARVNEVLARTRQPAICVYDISFLNGAMMMDILRAHPLTLVGGIVHDNPFFTPPEILLEEIKRRGRSTSAAMKN